MNIYDQVIGRRYTYLRAYIRRRRTIEDISQDKIIIKKTVLISDFNAYNSKQNSIYENLIGARLLKALLIKFNLIVINEEGVLIRRLSEKVFIIDLAITAPSMRDTMTQYIPEKSYSLISDYELIVISQPDLTEESAIFNNGRAIGWDIQNLIDDKDKLEAVALKQKSINEKRPYLPLKCSKENFEKKVIQLKDRLIDILNKNIKIVRITAHLKK